MATRLILVRHGQTGWNTDCRTSGRDPQCRLFATGISMPPEGYTRRQLSNKKCLCL